MSVTCTCGKEYKSRSGLAMHVRVSGAGHGEAGSTEPERPKMHVEVVVRLNGQELTVQEFLQLTNKFVELRESIRRLHPGGLME